MAGCGLACVFMKVFSIEVTEFGKLFGRGFFCATNWYLASICADLQELKTALCVSVFVSADVCAYLCIHVRIYV